ncbi:hypothetical protein K493DRAFT_313852 [Basidiobolus meristosporus CBS 931.73]|uniref:Fe2OG dioxygenase domain-containing protein n=1 Tax=Basidiobolus meristosporus CBS 931.73 TaxID=1314790 RepID=A0A1Y1YIZ4_9FUNG|nr:hypothetical protein K493DRAFT_313852 [Basidiobolus meristosporus CBS 931.73]|eukprot:ORX97997.1 hypothetical protein K493DRAFT_313852 [Basidiobolus meristosporus CBS 931.73]
MKEPCYVPTGIPGLLLIEDFITEEEEAELMAEVERGEWSGQGSGPNPEMKRRTQHYGYVFSYRYRRVMSKLGPLPEHVQVVVKRMLDLGVLALPPNSCIVNEYQPGQGIMPHIDAPTIFGPKIISLSLLSPCLMTFEQVKTREKHDVLLRPRSLVVMTEASRFDYKHSISKELVERFKKLTIERGRRVSLTFRTILSWDGKDSSPDPPTLDSPHKCS